MKASKVVFLVFLIILSLCVVATQPVKSQSSGIIYIRGDGSVEGTDRIQRDGNVYTFTGNIVGNITVQRDNIVIDGAGYALQGNGSGTGIALSNRNNIAIENMQISNFDSGIQFVYSHNSTVSRSLFTNNHYAIQLYDNSKYNTISGSTLANNVHGIYLLSASKNTITQNNVTNNGNGISLLYSADNNTIYNNIIGNSNANTPILEFPVNYAGAAIFMDQVMNNIISTNTITNSKYGIMTFEVSYNKIIGNQIANNSNGISSLWNAKHIVYHNNFINNTAQVGYNSPTVSTWDNGTAGNYWVDYTGVDVSGDGIGDTPYIVDANNQDRYPLMKPVIIPPVVIPEFPKPQPQPQPSEPFPITLIVAATAIIAIGAVTFLVYFRKIRKTTDKAEQVKKGTNNTI